MKKLIDKSRIRSACNQWLKGGVLLPSLIMALTTAAQQEPVTHRSLAPGEIPVSKPGYYGEPGRTYVLTNDIVSERSAIFLGRDVTLDLNGYRIVYAAASYDTLDNGGFEKGKQSWDLTHAPGARIMNTADVHEFVGDKLLSLEEGDEVRSDWIELPVAQRSYIAMVGITGRHFHDPKMKGDLKNEMKLSVFVEDEQGRTVSCKTHYTDSIQESAMVEKRSPRLGGGFIYAHLQGLPAGKYRIRVRADTDCLIDELNILPAMDVGIGIIGRTYARGHFDHLYNSELTAFFDYTADASKGTPVDFIKPVKGAGTVTIRNGFVVQGSKGAISWGLQSTASDVHIVLDRVQFRSQGYNSTSVDVPQATITHCRFEVYNPFLINRHGSNFYAVDLRGREASEVAYSTFIGGQGCLVFKAKHSSIHHNFFANNQAVTNHYSIMAMGDSSRIFDNRIIPIRGSGIEIYTHKYIEIFNNEISVQSSPPTCEYGREEYSANAIRIADYRAKPGAANGAFGNRVYNNRITVKAINFPQPEPYVPLSWAFFYSASGGDNEIFGNDIEIIHTAPASKALATAFFITGGTEGFGGNFYNNRIRTNVPAFWIAGKYGGTIRTRIANNTIIRTEGALPSFRPFRMGFDYCRDCIAREVVLESNTIVNDTMSIQVEGKGHSYQERWKLQLRLQDAKGQLLAGRSVVLKNAQGEEVAAGITNEGGEWSAVVVSGIVTPEAVSEMNPFTAEAEGEKTKIVIRNDVQQTITLGKKKRK